MAAQGGLMLGFGHVCSLGFHAIVARTVSKKSEQRLEDIETDNMIVELISRENKSSATSLYWPFQRLARRSDCVLHE